MAQEYTIDQPASSKNHVENIAVVGAGGNVGKFIAEALIENGQHKVTAITRMHSKSSMPAGLHDIKQVDYDDHSSLVEALRGQEVLIITMSVFAAEETQTRLIDAAADAGVKWIIPNEWGGDHTKEGLGRDTMLGPGITAAREYIQTVGAGTMRWVSITCSFWYEFSLAGTEARYGFDFNKKTMTFYDDGKTKILTTTWPQVGRAVASLLSMKVLPDNENDKGPTLSHWTHVSVCISSFLVSQRDMFESVLRVTGDSEQDWTVSYENVKERYKRGMKMLNEGNMLGFGVLLYARVFYPDGSGDYSDKLNNDVLCLPKEDFDEATKIAVKMAKDGQVAY